MFALVERKVTLGLAALTMIASAASASAAVVTYTDFNAFQSAAGSLTTEGFDTAPWTPVASTKSQGITNLGVSWTTANALFAGSINRSGPIAITSLDGTLGGTDIFDWIEAALPANTKSVGGWITTFNQLHTMELRAFDVFDNLLGSASLGNTGNAFAFVGLTADTAIAKVRFAATDVTNIVADDIALDDFSFGGGVASIPVPEPAAAALFGVGALAALLRSRRRNVAVGSDDTALAMIDRRLLADIGIGRGEVLSAAREIGVEQMRRARAA
jgi:uncharacterized protein YjiS (DUF1127 family)